MSRRKYAQGDNPFGMGNGACAKWIFANAAFDKDECLTWPFARSANGYGSLTYKKVGRSAHQLMCEAAHGPAPFDGAVARHKCGKGHEACVNPRHLAWSTQSENMMDRVAHGTHRRGIRTVGSKLSDNDVLAIRPLKGLISEQKIADQYGVSRGTIADIMHRRIWAWL